jgi:DNA-binding protein YbaB
MTAFEQSFAEIFAELGRQQAEFTAMRERVNAVSVTVTSAKRILTVTAGASGEITKLKFNGSGYRDMAPAELSTLVLETIQKARSGVAGKVKEAVGTFTGPGGLTMDDIRSGDIDLKKILPVGLPSNPKDIMAYLRGERANGEAAEPATKPEVKPAAKPIAAPAAKPATAARPPLPADRPRS